MHNQIIWLSLRRWRNIRFYVICSCTCKVLTNVPNRLQVWFISCVRVPFTIESPTKLIGIFLLKRQDDAMFGWVLAWVFTAEAVGSIFSLRRNPQKIFWFWIAVWELARVLCFFIESAETWCGPQITVTVIHGSTGHVIHRSPDHKVTRSCNPQVIIFKVIHGSGNRSR